MSPPHNQCSCLPSSLRLPSPHLCPGGADLASRSQRIHIPLQGGEPYLCLETSTDLRSMCVFGGVCAFGEPVFVGALCGPGNVCVHLGDLHAQEDLSVFWGSVCLGNCVGWEWLHCIVVCLCVGGTLCVFGGGACVWASVCFKHLWILRGSDRVGGSPCVGQLPTKVCPYEEWVFSPQPPFLEPHTELGAPQG